MTGPPIASKVANALVEDASAKLRVRGLTSLVRRWMLVRLTKHFGGLWVGGRLTLTARTLEFHPNALNRAMNEGTLDIVIDLRDVTSVELQPGVFTKIIAVSVGPRVFKSRCYGAQEMADRIRDAATAARTS